MFRKTVDLPADPSSALTRIAADSKYWLYINGELVVREGGLKRGPTANDTFYDEVDLAPYFTAGRNTVAVMVWFWGRGGYGHRNSGAGGLLFEADIDGRRVISDGSWRTIRNFAFTNTDAPVPNFRLAEHNIRFDAGAFNPDWIQTSYEDRGWPLAITRGQPPAAPWNRLYKRIIPQWKDYGRFRYENDASLPAVSDGSVIVGQLPHNLQAHPYLRVDAPAGLTIDVRTDHYEVNNITGTEKIPTIRAEYITKAGEQEWEMPAWLSGEVVEYRMPAGVRILELGYRQTGYDTEFTGTFESSDPFLNRLYEKSRRTAYVTMRDAFMDGPDRERSPAIGDGVVTMGAAFYAFDAEAHRLARKMLLDFINWQRADNTFYTPVPSAATYNNELPMLVLAGIGPYGLLSYYQHTGDLSVIEGAYPHVREYLGIWRIGGDGLVVQREGENPFYDWSTGIHEPLLDNTWFALALQAAIEMARLTGNESHIPGYQQQLDSIAENFNPVYWDGEAYRDSRQSGTDDRGNGLAVLAGFVPEQREEKVRDVLFSVRNAGTYLETYVSEALFQLGEAEGAMDRMRIRYKEMVEAEDLSTLWEFWERDKMTLNHAFGSGPARLLPQYVAGIEVTGPAFETFQVRPMLGDLTFASASVQSVRGRIASDVRIDDSVAADENGTPQVTHVVEVPAASRALVHVPRLTRKRRQLDVNGVTLFEGDNQTRAITGLSVQPDTDGYFVYEVGPGSWRFELFLESAPATFADARVDIEGGLAVLSWQTAREVENERFDIEERTNGSFGVIGTVAGAGSSDQALAYQFDLGRITAGAHTYRIKATASDGSVSFSPEIDVTVAFSGQFALRPPFPNPFQFESSFGLTVSDDQSVRVDFYDLLGRRVRTLFQGFLNAGEQYIFEVDGTGLSPGVYLFRVQGERFATARQVVKTR
ncbi:MAG: alpha-L-rhamnosidase C-terminal domain-containing protein [Bacteroidota bacterium]